MCGVFVFAKVVQENQLFLLLNLSATHPPSFFEEISFQPERCQELLAAYGRCCQCALHWDLDQFQTLNQAHRSGIWIYSEWESGHAQCLPGLYWTALRSSASKDWWNSCIKYLIKVSWFSCKGETVYVLVCIYKKARAARSSCICQTCW